ncbi:hypothetical protein BT93_A2107 [Corymbia citriodora subsp. variegata]|nr:hypothetical protein BT93_A2107 [Corymbia citriodora subsp. variegata]
MVMCEWWRDEIVVIGRHRRWTKKTVEKKREEGLMVKFFSARSIFLLALLAISLLVLPLILPPLPPPPAPLLLVPVLIMSVLILLALSPYHMPNVIVTSA